MEKEKGKIKCKYICNYHFVAECHDLEPQLNNTECSGLSEKEAREGKACEVWKKKMGC